MFISPLNISPLAKKGVSSAFSIANSFLFDGVNECFTIDDTLPLLAANTKGTWLVSVNVIDSTPTGNQRILGFGDTNAVEQISCFINSAGKLRFGCDIAGVSQWLLDTDNKVFLDNTWHTIGLTHDGIEPKIIFDGVEVAQTFTVGTTKASYFGAATGLDNGRIGCFNRASSGNANFFGSGYVGQLGFYDDDLSVSEVLDFHNGGTPKDMTTIRNVLEVFNPDNSGSTAQFTITGSVASKSAISVNMEDSDKTTVTPY